MRFESYAQELEDIVLYAVLQNVEEGFYIDVGANDPVDISVTKFFYDRGWRGINIEPLRSKCAMLEDERPRDINLCVGISNKGGEEMLIPGGGGGGVITTFSESVAEKGGFSNHARHAKTMLTLSDIYEQYCSRDQQIHFCKIDVEGYEKYVLEGISDWETYRPWIFVVEAAEPGTDIPAYEPWEDILLTNGYILAYATKINRYYLDKRKEHLLERFEEIDRFIDRNKVVRMEMTSIDDILDNWK